MTAEQILAARAADARRGFRLDPTPPPPPPITEVGGLRIHVLGSGSKGNALVIESATTALIVDAGFSRKATLERLAAVGVPGEKIAGILITHEHSDHTRGIGVLSRYLKVPIYTSDGTAESRSVSREVSAYRIHNRDRFTVGDIGISSFPTVHDARDPIGFRFEADGDAVASITDTGILTNEIRELITDVRILALESNHDETMLRTGPYPLYLKERIASDVGHLSNLQARDELGSIACARLETVVGMHLSETNNRPATSEATLRTSLEICGLGFGIVAARQNLPITVA